MLPETTVIPPSRSMNEEEDAAEPLSESLFHSCMSSFEDKQEAGEEEEVADSSSPDSPQMITASRQPEEVTATEATSSSGTADLTTATAAAEKPSEVASAETNNNNRSRDDTENGRIFHPINRILQHTTHHYHYHVARDDSNTTIKTHE